MYENGMQVIWDVVGKRVTIVFRGVITPLPGTFSSQGDGIKAGEEHCRRLGWNPDRPEP